MSWEFCDLVEFSVGLDDESGFFEEDLNEVEFSREDFV